MEFESKAEQITYTVLSAVTLAAQLVVLFFLLRGAQDRDALWERLISVEDAIQNMQPEQQQ